MARKENRRRTACIFPQLHALGANGIQGSLSFLLGVCKATWEEQWRSSRFFSSPANWWHLSPYIADDTSCNMSVIHDKTNKSRGPVWQWFPWYKARANCCCCAMQFLTWKITLIVQNLSKVIWFEVLAALSQRKVAYLVWKNTIVVLHAKYMAENGLYISV